MTVWFTSDHHFGHANILKFCERPFRSIDEMDEALIECWNAVVASTDEVWHLGDFAYRSGPNRRREIFDRLNGQPIHLVRGNHDKRPTLTLPWGSVHDYMELTLGGQTIVLFHYAMREWHRRHYGSWCLYGHSHGRLAPMPGTCDVGVDVWSFRPVSLEELSLHLGTDRTPA